MVNWTNKELDILSSYYEEEMKEEETKIETSSYPPDEQLAIEKSQAIIWLVKDMKNPKSWIYRLCHEQPTNS